MRIRLGEQVSNSASLQRRSGPSGFSFDEFLLTGEYKANIVPTQFDEVRLIALSAEVRF